MPPCATCNKTGDCVHPKTTTTRPKVLFVVTSHDQLGSTDRKTGWYLVRSSIYLSYPKTLTTAKPEGAHPYEVLIPHVDITWASPKGGRSPLDPMSEAVSETDTVTQAFLKRDEQTWRVTEKLETFLGRAGEFAAVFYVGGWGRECALGLGGWWRS
jgi:hypothetical protein